MLGEIKVAELKPQAIRKAKDKLRTTGGRDRAISGATANRYMASLSRCCSFAVADGLLSENPARPVKVTRAKEEGRNRILTPEERTRLLDACRAEDPQLHALLVLALTTGGRQNELLTLRVQQINLDAGRVSFLKTKNGQPRTVPLPAAAIELLRGLGKVRSIDGYLFGARAQFPLQRRARQAAGLGDFRFHDTRHCFATALAEAHATLSELMAALGHKGLQMVKRYQHLTERAGGHHPAAACRRGPDLAETRGL